MKEIINFKSDPERHTVQSYRSVFSLKMFRAMESLAEQYRVHLSVIATEGEEYSSEFEGKIFHSKVREGCVYVEVACAPNVDLTEFYQEVEKLADSQAQ